MNSRAVLSYLWVVTALVDGAPDDVIYATPKGISSRSLRWLKKRYACGGGRWRDLVDGKRFFSKGYVYQNDGYRISKVLYSVPK